MENNTDIIVRVLRETTTPVDIKVVARRINRELKKAAK